jgi:aminodeoxychorismate lyase
MSSFLAFNGEIISEAAFTVSPQSRAFRYGDGFFETIRTSKGYPLFLDAHWQRLQRTAKFLHIEMPKGLTKDKFVKLIADVCAANDAPHSRLRIQFYRTGEGTYLPQTNECDWVMHCSSLAASVYKLNPKGLTVGLYPTCPVPVSPIGNHKTANALPYVLASIYAKDKKWDDALLLNTQGFITEATSSNLFLVKGNEVLTPDLTKGGLPGVMRARFIELAQKNGFEVKIVSITPKEMLWADECLLTNAISGLQWVLAFGQKRYFHRHADVFVKQLNQLAGLV